MLKKLIFATFVLAFSTSQIHATKKSLSMKDTPENTAFAPRLTPSPATPKFTSRADLTREFMAILNDMEIVRQPAGGRIPAKL